MIAEMKMRHLELNNSFIRILENKGTQLNVDSCMFVKDFCS